MQKLKVDYLLEYETVKIKFQVDESGEEGGMKIRARTQKKIHGEKLVLNKM